MKKPLGFAGFHSSACDHSLNKVGGCVWAKIGRQWHRSIARDVHYLLFIAALSIDRLLYNNKQPFSHDFLIQSRSTVD